MAGNGDALFEVKGLNQLTGKPQRFSVHTSEIREALEPVARQITDAVRRCVEQLSPELASDVFTERRRHGRRRCAAARLAATPARGDGAARCASPEDPLMCVMRGLIEILHHRDRYEELIVNSRAPSSLAS